ncbi:sensor domain-containing diguanylate cyclase [Leptospira terpstrae]|uniref:diguanylate cyclase n=1 Tax=Leptospira terpstrae serovar Hualin str. LT 11-33 = ATCC 700639 TaxID=1257025 RepID=N1W1D8_9LEPT|nr:sensor domain-containing diguanylate cyclase [Leptospira terpstrae]EMY61491.1 diguanylate cyclase (GGDEF) domain protein [Leptospira terpstrae serovar Hualin str. LT 11-33 = ATCC 700639]
MSFKENTDIVFEHYEKKIYDQKQLLEISRALNSTLDYKYLIDAILNICLAQLQTLHAAMYLEPEIDLGLFKLEPQSIKGFELSSEEQNYEIKIDSPLIHYFEEKPKAITMDQILQMESLKSIPDITYLRKMGAEILVPLNAKGKVNGLLVLGDKMTSEEFLEDEKEFMTTLANLAGIAVDNARLYELATVDMMTGLKIHHYFQTKLKEEMDRCRKKGTKLCLLFTDVDHFKRFNDTYGHQAGDVVLIEVAKQVIGAAQRHHIPARYGGEEFCLVMPGASEEEAMLKGEEIRKAVESMVVKNPNDGADLKVTLSVGVSSFRTTDRNNKDLIERADKALYQAKHSGRNRTICYKD